MKRTTWLVAIATSAIVWCLGAASALAHKHHPAKSKPVTSIHGVAEYRVTVQNLTGGQPFTPPVLSTEAKPNTLFAQGQRASFELKEIAENGNTTPFLRMLGSRLNAGSIYDLRVSPTLLVPSGLPGSQPNAPAPCNMRSSRHPGPVTAAGPTPAPRWTPSAWPTSHRRANR